MIIMRPCSPELLRMKYPQLYLGWGCWWSQMFIYSLSISCQFRWDSNIFYHQFKMYTFYTLYYIYYATTQNTLIFRNSLFYNRAEAVLSSRSGFFFIEYRNII